MQVIICQKGYEATISELKSNYDLLSEDGCFYAILGTEYDRMGNVTHDFLQVIKHAVDIGYTYVNTIVYPTIEKQDCVIKDNVRYVIWLCKNHQTMKFNKDTIREKHIWKDVEWGKRTKNYNPKGKDPGNVWIPTNDDGKANITEHILLSDEEVINKLLAMSCCGEDYMILKEETAHNHYEQQKDVSEANPCKEDCYGKVIFASSEQMMHIQDNTVKVAITSPPYWNLKDYFKKGQIGQETYQEYLDRMETVWQQCYQKLTDNGSLWVNINIRNQKGKVILIPYDIIAQCKRIGFFYKGIMIWHKSSGIPTGEKNIVDRHEYVLIFSKTENFTVHQNKFADIKDYKNPVMNGGAFWNINRKAGSVGKKYIHPAIYPNELVRRIVDICSEEGDLVMDPFLGSGTSLIASLQANRNFVGYEYNEGFKDLMMSRFELELNNLGNVEFVDTFQNKE